MLHIVPILCLIFFIFFMEYKLKTHVNETDTKLKHLSNGFDKMWTKLEILEKSILDLENKLKDEDLCNK